MADVSRADLRSWLSQLTTDPIDPYREGESRYVALEDSGRDACGERLSPPAGPREGFTQRLWRFLQRVGVKLEFGPVKGELSADRVQAPIPGVSHENWYEVHPLARRTLGLE